jgi:DNA-binding MarR family transcriptional regulator
MSVGSLKKELDLLQLAALRSALAPLQTEVSLPQLVTLMTIALEPGLSVNELADRIGAPQQTASRYASVLLGRYKDPSDIGGGQAKAALISQVVNASDPRSRALHLTPRGWAFISELLGAVGAKG